MTADVRLYRSACVWCLPVLLVGLPSWPLAVLSALAWWLLGKVTIRSSATSRLLPETSRMLQWRIFFPRRSMFARLSAEVTMRAATLPLTAIALALNFVGSTWDFWMWLRIAAEVALGIIGVWLSRRADQLAAETHAAEATEEAVAIIRAAASRPVRPHVRASAPATD
jgi:hypothetical protein